MASLQLQLRARRPGFLRSSTPLDRHSRSPRNPPLLRITAIAQTRRATGIVRLAAGVIRRARLRVRKSRRHVDKRVRTGHRRPRRQRPVSRLVVGGGCCRAVLRESETAGVGGRGEQRACAAGAAWAAGNVIGFVACAARPVPAAYFGVVEC